MKPQHVLSIALATMMLLAVVSSAGVVAAKPSTKLTSNEQRMSGLGYIVASLYKFWQSKLNPTLPGQIEITQPITMLLNGIASLVGGVGDVAPPVGE